MRSVSWVRFRRLRITRGARKNSRRATTRAVRTKRGLSWTFLRAASARELAQALPELERRAAGVLLERTAELGGVLEGQPVGHFGHADLGMQQQALGLEHHPLADQLRRRRAG